MEKYPLADYTDNDDRAAHMLRDFFFLCGTHRVAAQLSRQGVPVWVYEVIQL